MDYLSCIVVFSCVFWVTIFMILPIGIKIPKIQERGHASSAPSNPNILIKIIATSIISALLTWLIVYLIDHGYLAFLITDKL